jgi:hypothetical protein
MSVLHELEGAKVIKQTKNDPSHAFGIMFFEEEGATIEITITALAIAQYENEEKYYLFMCDEKWTVQDDHILDSVEEAIEWTEKNFDISEKDWL